MGCRKADEFLDQDARSQSVTPTRRRNIASLGTFTASFCLAVPYLWTTAIFVDKTRRFFRLGSQRNAHHLCNADVPATESLADNWQIRSSSGIGS